MSCGWARNPAFTYITFVRVNILIYVVRLMILILCRITPFILYVRIKKVEFGLVRTLGE